MEKYTAFISYRHKPIDIAVAARLHKLLERYTVPKALRKDGQKRLGKVFRDRDELSLDSDLTQRLRNALDASDYLIVICTPDTPDSAWVTEEISYFLKNHSQDRVFTVLADGTSENAFPAALTQEYDDDGKPIHGRIHEPLAANTAADTDRERMQKLENEFLRLVAPMLGCTYDELYRREARYRRKRRITAACTVAAVALAFTAVLLITHAKVRAQRMQAQINESNVLAELSMNQLQEGDAFEALKTAYSAMPGETDRPLTREAQIALAKTLYAYQPAAYRADISIEIYGTVMNAAFSPDGFSVAVLDNANNLYMINSLTGGILWKTAVSCDFPQNETLDFFSDGAAVVCFGEKEAVTYDVVSGRLLCTVRPSDIDPSAKDLNNSVLSADGDTLVCVYWGENKETYAALADLRTGSVRGKQLLSSEDRSFFKGAVSADGSRFYLLLAEWLENDSMDFFLYTMDAASGTVLRENVLHQKEFHQAHLLPVKLTDGDGLLVALVESFRAREDRILFAVIGDGEKDWRRTWETHGEYAGIKSAGAVVADGYIYAYLGQYILRMSLSGGGVELCDLLPYNVLGMIDNGEDGFSLVFPDGKLCSFSKYYYDTAYAETTELLNFTASGAYGTFQNGDPIAFVPKEHDNRLCVYRIAGDPHFRQVEEKPDFRMAEDGAEGAYVYPMPDGERFLFLEYRAERASDEGSNDIPIDYFGTVYSSATGEKLKTFYIPRVRDHLYLPQGFSSDGSKIYFDGYVYDLGTDVFTPLAENIDDAVLNNDYDIAVPDNGETCISVQIADGRRVMWRYDCESAGETLLPAEWVSADFRYGATAEDQHVTVGKSRMAAAPVRRTEKEETLNGFLLLNTETGDTSVIECASGSSDVPLPYDVAENSQLLAVAEPDNVIRMYDMKHSGAVRTIPIKMSSLSVSEMRFIMDDTVLMLQQYGHVWLLDAVSGTLLYHQGNYYSNTVQCEFQWVKEEDLLLIGSCVLDTRNWAELYQIPDLSCYMSGTGTVITLHEVPNGEPELRLNKLYTADDLSAWARQKLADREAGVAG